MISTHENDMYHLQVKFNKRDIVLNVRNNTLRRISEIHPYYYCYYYYYYYYYYLQYPLSFCYGEDEYSINIPQVNPFSWLPLENKTVSAMSFYACRIMFRYNNHNDFHHLRSLFRKFVFICMLKLNQNDSLLYEIINQNYPRKIIFICKML